jgi:DNA-binding transcriptional regulator YhcF (GntR family)
MTVEKIMEVFLKEIYEVWDKGQRVVSFRQIADDNKINKLDMQKVISQMESQGLISNPASNWHFQLTDKAVLFSEQKRLISEEFRLKNERTRTLILDALAKAYDEKGPYAFVNINMLAAANNSTDRELFPNLDLLRNLNYIKATAQNYQITQSGLSRVQVWRQKEALSSEYDEIAELTPQARGRRFQKLLAKIIESHGWSQEEGVQTSNEEMDVIVFQNREYYLIECKWEKEPIQALVIRELNGKLSNRVDVRGIVASVSGFTAGAGKQVEDYSGQKIILLFGPEDIKALVYQTTTFDDLLNQKYKELVTKRKAIFN